MVQGASWGIRAVGPPCQGDRFVKVLGWRIKEGCAVLGPTGLILGSTQLEPSLDKGTSREDLIGDHRLHSRTEVEEE